MGTWHLNKDFIFLDGAMGTMLQKLGMELGERPELLCLTQEAKITEIHRLYLEAGSDILYTNTFGASPYKLEGTGAASEEVISKAVELARRACRGTKALVALDIGPIGALLEPAGTLNFQDAYQMFRRQMAAGAAAGANLIVIETMADLYEMKAAVLAAKESTRLPVFATMTFEENRRTFSGCSVSAMAAVLEGLGVDAMGINCSLGPHEIYPIARELSGYTSLPLIVKANAGLPDPVTGEYAILPEEFAREMRRYAELGVTIVGGCCGTTPEYIRKLKEAFAGAAPAARQPVSGSILCTPTRTVSIDGVRVIGERINPTGKPRFQQALREGDLNYIVSQGVSQAEAGADILDVNVGLPDIDEPKVMETVVKSLQSVLDLPLQIDSSDPLAIEAGLRACNGKAAVNSVNGDRKVLGKVLPIVKKYGAAVVGLTLDEKGIPATAEERFAIAERILAEALRHGIRKEDVYIDCLTMTVSARQADAAETLRAVSMVREKLGLHTVLGVSNISFGLPRRELINRSFLTLAMGRGLTLPILNPNSREMMDTVAAFRLLSGEDKDSKEYIARFSGSETVQAAPEEALAPGESLEYAISRGLKDETRQAVKSLLSSTDGLTIVNEHLIPALDRVGDRFERGEIFLPQLIHSAAAAQQAFEEIKTVLSKAGGAPMSKGKIVLATVRGDIHDIGKNIVKIILENYGYKIIDLGRDVEPNLVAKTAIKEGAGLVGLSALMTTTLKSMEETITILRKSGHGCKIMVGGAVLTPEYAARIGADYYAKDAKQAADIAKEVLG
ncbi:homocysteine S-methyltransferase family protein [Papillibacter cinnamivorans]|uniref:Methionine synthase n=1 Tax=Papillibacter cinnamivorans DSM 12816 TaxID=1122930 RepID=A0A1W1YZV1_9FIRM|nr:homocysteine S-methyltransferase family protein [Papillibacter cinnamivorans]SMC41351.1 5-methyltetrahydrofolate--homocysteine methyltransferase [Papillibacter cinnamivorans DSM 12816]